MVVAPSPGAPPTPVTQPPHCTAPPTIQPSAPPTQAVPPTHPLPPPIPDVLPSSTAPSPIVKPSPHPPAPHIQPPLPASISNEMMLKLLATNPAWMNVLRPYKHPSSSWTNLTVAPPTPSTQPTVAGSLQSLQATPVPTPSTHPMGMPILPHSAILQHSKLSHTIGRVTARVVGPASVSHSQCIFTPPSIGLEASPVLAMRVPVGVWHTRNSVIL